MGGLLEQEERNLLSAAFKNVVGAKRSSWRTISSFETKYEDEELDRKRNYAIRYRESIENEIKDECQTVLSLLDKHLVPGTNVGLNSDVPEEKHGELVRTKVFYLKMMGDYSRYLAEVLTDEAKKKAMESAGNAYTDAYDMCEKGVGGIGRLSKSHPLRLGLALNYSVYYYELLEDQVQACELAKEAFDGALAEIDTVNEKAYKDTTQIMQLLKDNLTSWYSTPT